MNKETIRKRILEIGIIPSIRVSTTEDALFAAEAVSSSGIPIVEVTMTVPGASAVIAELVRKNPDTIVGAGTILDIDTARRCMDVGAQFLTSPGLEMDVVDYAVKRNIVVFPGAMTPTEIMMAWKAGADFVKIFPCASLGGPSYIKALRSPFPEVRLIAAGRSHATQRGGIYHGGSKRHRHRPASGAARRDQAARAGLDSRACAPVLSDGPRGAYGEPGHCGLEPHTKNH